MFTNLEMRVIKGFHLILASAKSIAMHGKLIRVLIYQPAEHNTGVVLKHFFLPYVSFLNKHEEKKKTNTFLTVKEVGAGGGNRRDRRGPAEPRRSLEVRSTCRAG